MKRRLISSSPNFNHQIYCVFLKYMAKDKLIQQQHRRILNQWSSVPRIWSPSCQSKMCCSSHSTMRKTANRSATSSKAIADRVPYWREGRESCVIFSWTHPLCFRHKYTIMRRKSREKSDALHCCYRIFQIKRYLIGITSVLVHVLSSMLLNVVFLIRQHRIELHFTCSEWFFSPNPWKEGKWMRRAALQKK